jgi:hypothetical protein
MHLDEFEKIVDEMVGVNTFSVSDPTSVVTLNRINHKLESFTTRVVTSFEESAEWAIDGAQSAAAWFATKCLLPSAEVKGMVRRGRMLEKSPIVAAAFAAGEIGAAQVDVLARARRAAEPYFERDEEMLVEQSKNLKFAPFSTAIDYWTQLADPDGADEAELERASRRDVYLLPSLNGMYLGKMTLDPTSGAKVSNELERLEEILFAADWAEAKERLGREPMVSELRRTPGQRRADALVEMATRSATAPADGKRPEPLITILVDYPTIKGRICRIEGGPVIAPGSLLPLIPEAWFERMVFGPGNRVDCSQQARFFTGGTRRSIEVRDLECTNPYCETPGPKCQVDHIVPYSHGGLTEQGNGQLLCGRCNRQRWLDTLPPGG